jgi:hypothetical protein
VFWELCNGRLDEMSTGDNTTGDLWILYSVPRGHVVPSIFGSVPGPRLPASRSTGVSLSSSSLSLVSLIHSQLRSDLPTRRRPYHSSPPRVHPTPYSSLGIMARAGPSGAAASGEATPHASPETHRQTAAAHSPPLPSNSIQFNFACRCLNVQVNGRVPNEVGEKINARPADVWGEDLHRVYLGEKTEDVVSVCLGLPSREEDQRSSLVWWICIRMRNLNDPVGADEFMQKFPLHVTFDQRDEEEERISQVDQGDEPRRDLLPPSWRTCWICGVRCYQVPGKLKLDPPAEEQWVTVDIGSGIRVGLTRGLTRRQCKLS